ncbi:MAG: hypothetical protein H6Q90_318 [Deltaproteobacteria bacterium]|nr:hypothetical protein [Deltaproteobacteria bacterium]
MKPVRLARLDSVWGRAVVEPAAFGLALVALILGSAGGPGWTAASNQAVLAVQLERDAGAPIYSLIAGLASYLPVGEPGFRLAVLNALLGAILLAGVLRATRALLPPDPVAGWIATLVLALSPGFREAVGFAGPAVLAAVGAVWSIAFALEHARKPRSGPALAALVCVALTIGSAPWLGAALGLLVVGWLWRARPATHNAVVVGVFAIGAMMVGVWYDALGRLPALVPDLTAAVAASGRGSSAIIVGGGLLGAAFGALTGLASARWLVAAIALATVHAIAVNGPPVAMLGLLAIGCAIVPSAIVRAVPSLRPYSRHRHLIAFAAGLPLVVAAVLTGPAHEIDDPRDAPARLATDLIGSVPAGPGVFIATRTPTWSAIEYAQVVAGARPDLVLAPPLPSTTADTLAVNALRTGQVAAADVPAFGRLEPRWAYPRGRGFELHLEAPPMTAPILLPARYASELGAEQGVLLAVDRARYEGVSSRLGLAARAAGLTHRFGAADLAILSTTAPSRPAMFDFIPNLDGLPPGPWLLELLGDDLAWVAGIDPPAVEQPRERKLHTLWRALWRGEIQRTDPAIAALGPMAVMATDQMLAATTKK